MDKQKLLKHASGRGYPFFLGLVAAADYGLFLMPMVPITVASVAVVPKRWFWIALSITLGSWGGALVFEFLVGHYGLDFLHWMSPQMTESHFWLVMENWIHRYGLLGLFIVALLPMVDHPIIALAALSKMPFPGVAFSLLIGKVLKFFFFSWCGAHAPDVLHRFKFLKKN